MLINVTSFGYTGIEKHATSELDRVERFESGARRDKAHRSAQNKARTYEQIKRIFPRSRALSRWLIKRNKKHPRYRFASESHKNSVPRESRRGDRTFAASASEATASGVKAFASPLPSSPKAPLRSSSVFPSFFSLFFFSSFFFSFFFLFFSFFWRIRCKNAHSLHACVPGMGMGGGEKKKKKKKKY